MVDEKKTYTSNKKDEQQLEPATNMDTFQTKLANKNTIQGTNLSPKTGILKMISFSQGGIC